MRIALGNLQHPLALILALTTFSVESAQTSYYIYDEAGHVIGEYDANGNVVQEHIYLGDRPVAVVQNQNVDYVSTDQLGTPRAVTDTNRNVVWQWNSDPFGNGSPTGSLTYNMRFPGQYFDSETGHNYNYERDYDPGTGRYIESDPIGLKGGLNTYGYVGESPIDAIDPHGLIGMDGNGKVYGNWCGGNWTGGYAKSWDQMSDYEQSHAAQPIGPLDLACEQHDKCYGACRLIFPCNPAYRSGCFRHCDRTLAGKSSEIFDILSTVAEHSMLSVDGYEEMMAALAVSTAMSRPGNRNPEQNGKNCPNCTTGH